MAPHNHHFARLIVFAIIHTGKGGETKVSEEYSGPSVSRRDSSEARYALQSACDTFVTVLREAREVVSEQLS